MSYVEKRCCHSYNAIETVEKEPGIRIAADVGIVDGGFVRNVRNVCTLTCADAREVLFLGEEFCSTNVYVLYHQVRELEEPAGRRATNKKQFEAAKG